MKARWCAYIFPHKRQRPLHWSPFFSSKVAKRLMRIRHRLLLHLFFPTKGNEMPSKKCNIFNKSAGHHIFYEWPLYAPLHKKLSLWSFRRKYCTTKDGAQTYDFIADKRCLLFSIILKVLSGWDSYQNTGKMYKIIYKNFWKDFVVEQNLTRLRGDFWCFLNRPYEIVVIWDDWQYGSLVSIIIVFNCTRGEGVGFGEGKQFEAGNCLF